MNETDQRCSPPGYTYVDPLFIPETICSKEFNLAR